MMVVGPDSSTATRRIRIVLLLGAGYWLVGIVFAAMDRVAPAGRFWRLAAWAVSAVAFLAHVGYERFRLRGTPMIAALNAAAAAALGACLLAVSATIRA